MKPNTPLSAVMMLGLSILTACQTPSASVSLDVVQLQETAVNVAKAEWCAGQMPRSLDSIEWIGPDGSVYYGVTEDDFRAVPEWVQIYIIGNDEQWAVLCQP